MQTIYMASQNKQDKEQGGSGKAEPVGLNQKTLEHVAGTQEDICGTNCEW